MGVKSLFFSILLSVFVFCQASWAGTLEEMSKKVYDLPGIKQVSLKAGEIYYSSAAKDPGTLAFTIVLGKINQGKQQEELASREFGAGEYQDIRLSPLVLVPGSEIIIFGANFRLPDETWQHGLFVYFNGVLEKVFQNNQSVQERNLNWMSDPAYDEYANRICFAIGGTIQLVDFDKEDPLRLLADAAVSFSTGDAEIKNAPAVDGKYVVFFSRDRDIHLVEKAEEFPVFWRIPVSVSGISGAKILTVEGFPQGEILLSTYTRTQLISIDYLTLREKWRSEEYAGICSIPPLATAPQFSKWLASLKGKLYEFGTDGKTVRIYPSGEENFGIILWLAGYNQTGANQTRDLLFLETDERLLNCRLWLYERVNPAKSRLVHRETSRHVSTPATDGKLIAVPVEDFLVVFRPARTNVNIVPIISPLLLGN